VNIGLSGIGPPVQLAYLVPDVEQAAQEWAANFGAGPFFLRSHIEVHDVVYRGRPGVFDHSSAYGQWGPVMVELVQDHGLADSIGRDMYGVDESGIHHHAHFVDDLDATVAAFTAQGFTVAMSARSTATEFRFIDTVDALGHFIELYERSSRLVGFYEMVAAAAQDWDGQDPVRHLG
jgi:Glyoxalase/Bleomycin resistance protein/Dioxygenase superfamily